MTPTLQQHKFYQALGYLFYAIAAADKNLRTLEIESLHQLIKTTWIPLNEESEAVFQIQIIFDRLLEQHCEGKYALATFKKFEEKHKDIFTDDVKKRIWETVNTIAESVAGKNKSELVMLSKLSIMFKN